MLSLSELSKRFNQRIEQLNFDKAPVELYEPINYTLKLGGKRLRPALCLLACDMFGGKIDEAIEPAIGLEIFHNFTLLHDDIMDQAPIRRGKETVYKKWDTNVAILSGDTMMALAYEHIMKAPEAVRSEVFSVFNSTAIEVCEGQQYDMNFETQKNISIEDYLAMIRLKTAVLLAASLKIGAIISGAEKSVADELYRFGENIGIAFQLKDDLLDVFSNVEKFGKTTGGDIIANKKTYPYLKAFELAKGSAHELLSDYFSRDFENPLEKVIGVKEIYRELNIEEITESEINRYYSLAMNSLKIVNVTKERKTELIQFADKLKLREN
ncbi:MAG: polyprenyl synthetase family protein [Bacteroidales bacterium]|nr:polyprenyl synthetase family protein [Bacteroidales bacterium]